MPPSRIHYVGLLTFVAITFTGEAQSIFTAAPSPSTNDALTGAPTTTYTSIPSRATVAPTSITTTAPASQANGNSGSSSLQFTFSFQLITKVTTALPDIDAATAVVESQFTNVIKELAESETSGGRVAFDNVDTTVLQACQNLTMSRQHPLFDECHEAQSTVSVSIDSTLSPEVAKYAVIEQVQSFAESYNRNQTDMIILFQSPKYVSTNLNVILVAVSGAMDKEAKNLLNQLFSKALAPYLQANQKVPFTLLTAQVLTESPYDPSANSTRRRHLQVDPSVIAENGIDLSNVDPNTIPFNDLQVYVQATCADMNCSQDSLEDALYTNATDYVTDLALAIQVNRQLLLSQYFDNLYDILVARDPQLADLPTYDRASLDTDDIVQVIQTDPAPSYIWVLLAVNGGVIAITIVWILVQSHRRDRQEQEHMEKFKAAVYGGGNQ